MRIPFIVHQEKGVSGNVAREMFVINGQAYYFSSRESSGTRFALPFLMMRGTERRPGFQGAPTIFNVRMLEKFCSRFTDPGLLVKLTSDVLTSTAQDLTSSDNFVDEKTIKTWTFDGDKKVEVSTKLGDFIRRRVPTKATLITSARLSLGSLDKDKYDVTLLKKLGLNDEEIKQASEPLYLESTPIQSFELNWPDETDDKSTSETKHTKVYSQIHEINKWLARQGGQIAHVITKKPDFDVCQMIWEQAEVKSKDKSSTETDRLIDESLPVLHAKKFLSDYYTKGSRCNRFWALTWGRNHVPEVNTVLNEKHENIRDLLQSLKAKLSSKNVNKDGALMRCIDFLEYKAAQSSSNDNDYKSASLN